MKAVLLLAVFLPGCVVYPSNKAEQSWRPPPVSDPPQTLSGGRTTSPLNERPRAWIDGNGQLQYSPGCLQDDVCRAEAVDLATQISDEYEAMRRGG